VPVGPIDICGLTKVIGEDLTTLFHLETGVRTIIARFFNVYGPNDTNPHVIPEITRQLKSGSREVELGNLLPKRDFIYIQDVIDAVLRLLERFDGEFDIFNIGSGREHSVSDIVEFCSQILGEEIRVRQAKERIRRVERLHLLANIKIIQKAIGWSPKIDLREGLKKLLLDAY